MKQATIGELFAMRKTEKVKLADAVKMAQNTLGETLKAKDALDVISVFGKEFKADCLVLDANALAKLSNLKPTTRVSIVEAELLKHYGIAVESETLDASALNLLKSNVLKPIDAAILVRNMKLDLAEQAEVSNTRAMQRAETAAEKAERDHKKAVAAEYKRLLLSIVETFGNGDKVTTKHVREIEELESLFSRQFPKEDNLTGSIGEFVCNELYWLASLDSATTAAVSARVEEVKGLVETMPYLVEFLNSIGTTIVRAPDGFNSVDNPELPDVPSEKPNLVRWFECAAIEETDLGHNTAQANDVRNVRAQREARETLLWQIASICKKHPQTGVFSSIKAFEKVGIPVDSVDGEKAAVKAGLSGMDKILQGAINSAVRLAVRSRGADLSLLNYLNSFAIVYTPNVGFRNADYKDYILDTLPHLVWKAPKGNETVGKWELRGQRALENAKLGQFGIHLFGELPMLADDGSNTREFPILCLNRFRQIKREAQSIARETNKREKERHASQWKEYSEAWEAAKPVEARLASIEAELAKLDQHHEELTKQANALRHAKKA